MTETPRSEPLRVALDLAKNVLQIHVETGTGRWVTSRAVRRDRLLPWLQSNLSAGTAMAM